LNGDRHVGLFSWIDEYLSRRAGGHFEGATADVALGAAVVLPVMVGYSEDCGADGGHDEEELVSTLVRDFMTASLVVDGRDRHRT
jgi:hypothetical protein